MIIKILKRLLLLLILFSAVSTLTGCGNSSNLSTLDNEEEEIEELLDQAKKHANSSNFSKAKSALNEARKVGGNSDEYSEALAYVNRKKDDYNERQSVANQRSSGSNYSGGSSSSSSSNRLTKVEIYAQLSGVNNNVEAFTVSGSGDIYNNTDHTSIFNRNGVAGRYSYSATIKDYSFMGQTKTMVCSGSFSVSGRKSSVYLTMSPLDCSSYINEY